MLLNKIKEAVSPKVGQAVLATKANSPELYMAGGIALGILGAILFARAHKKSDEVLGETFEQIDSVREFVYEENEKAVEQTGHEVISRADEQKMLTPLYGTVLMDTAKLYGPALLVGIGSIALLLASRGELRRRNSALLSTVALVERGFATYRSRIIEEYGEEADMKAFYGAESRDVVTLEEDEKGKTKKKRSKRLHIPEEPAPLLYGRVFDFNNKRWSPDRDRNELFLQSAQDTANNSLLLDGHVFLNDVYRDLGFKDTAIGAVVGWTKDSSTGDGYVSFGLDKSINVNEGDNRWMLDFNVQGNILDELGNDPGTTF